jgi:hypothetical protein
MPNRIAHGRNARAINRPIVINSFQKVLERNGNNLFPQNDIVASKHYKLVFIRLDVLFLFITLKVDKIEISLCRHVCNLQHLIKRLI